METKIVDEKQIDICAAEIQKGNVVAFPTETVYGLGASAFEKEAVKKIFEAKGRPSDNPLIVHVCDIEQAKEISYGWNSEIEKLVNHFWPGPLTVVLPKKDCIPYEVSGGLDTIGIRMPKSEVALKFIRECNAPICAPSANRSTRPSPTKAIHVYNDLKGRIPYIIDGGSTSFGLESTVVDCTKEGKFTILRPGNITKEDLLQVVDNVEIDAGVFKEAKGKVASPGMKYKHYAPNYGVDLVCGEHADEKIISMYENYTKQGKKCVIIIGEGNNLFEGLNCIEIGGDLNEYSRRVYDILIELEGKVDVAIFKGVKESGVGLAIMNRLRRAAGENIIYS